MDITALNKTGGWIAVGLLLLYFFAELVVILHNTLLPGKPAEPATGEESGPSPKPPLPPFVRLLRGTVILLPSFVFVAWLLFFGGYDVFARFTGSVTSIPFLQGFMLLAAMLFASFLPIILGRLFFIKTAGGKGFKNPFAFLRNEGGGMAVLVFTIMVGLVLLLCWLLWRFPLTVNGTIAVLIFYRFFSNTNWYRERSFSGSGKKDSLGAQEERHALVSAWLSRVGSGITAIHFQAGGRTGAFVRGSGGGKVMLIRFSRLESPPSEELIFLCARALAYNRSRSRNSRSLGLLFTGLAGGLFYFWGATTAAMPLALEMKQPAYFPGLLLTGYLTFIICYLLVQWLTFPAYKKMNAEADAFVLAYTDAFVQHRLKTKIEKELEGYGEVPAAKSWSLTPSRQRELQLRLERLNGHLNKSETI